MVLSRVSTAVARTVLVEATRRRGPEELACFDKEVEEEEVEECDLRPEKEDKEFVESETRSEEEELKPWKDMALAKRA